MDEPIMPLTSRSTESSKLSPRTRVGCSAEFSLVGTEIEEVVSI